MKYRWVAVLAIVLSTAPCRAKTVGGEISLFGGLTIPMQPEAFRDYWNPGLRIGGGGGVCLFERLSLVAEATYNRCTVDKKKVLTDAGLLYTPVQLSGGTGNILTITGGANAYALPSSFPAAPYIAFRAGYTRQNIDDVIVSVPGQGSVTIYGGSEGGFQMYFGLGINFSTGPYMDLFVEGRYGIGFLEGDNTGYVPVTAGLKMKM